MLDGNVDDGSVDALGLLGFCHIPGDAQIFQLGDVSRQQSILLSLGSPTLCFLGCSRYLPGSVFKGVSSLSPPAVHREAFPSVFCEDV